MMRASTLEVLSQDYVLTARALGLSQRLIVFKYVLKNALSATLTVIGLYFGWLLGGTVLVETVFDWPGIGLYATKAITSQDFMPIMGVTLCHRRAVRDRESRRRPGLWIHQSEGAADMSAPRVERTIGPRRAPGAARRDALAAWPLSLPRLDVVAGRLRDLRASSCWSPWSARPLVPYPEHVAGGIAPRVRFQPALLRHLFGTNELGQDVFSLVVAGARVSLLCGLAVVLVGAIVGTFFGAIAGYFGGWIDEIIMRLTDLKLTIPGLILAMAVAAALGPGIVNMIVAISLSWWPGYARLVRGEVLAKKEEVFVLAARALGASHARPAAQHILPNIFGPVIVKMSLDMGFAILTVAALGFIGIGVKPPTPEWGSLLAIARGYMPEYWWTAVFPGASHLPRGVRLQSPRRRPARRARSEVAAVDSMALLEIHDLHLTMRSYDGEAHVLNGIDLTLERGEIRGLVGETGCGKSLTGLSVSRLVATPPGRYTGGPHPVRGARPHGARRTRHARAARPAHRHDLPGPDDQPQSGLPHQRTDDRCRAARRATDPEPSRRRAQGARVVTRALRPAASPSRCSPKSASAIPRVASTTIRTSSPAACASAC